MTDHTGNTAGHVVDRSRHGMLITSMKENQRTGHSCTGSNAAATESRKLTGILFDIHADKIA